VGCAPQTPTDAHSQATSGAIAVEASTPVLEPAALAIISPEGAALAVRPSSATLLSRPIAAAAVAVSPDGRLVVTVNPDSDSITLVDAITLAVVAEIPVGYNSRTLSLTPDSKKALVANHGSATLSTVDLGQAVEFTQYPVGFMPYRGFCQNSGLALLWRQVDHRRWRVKPYGEKCSVGTRYNDRWHWR
jgi:YVTN family beta-propeller protein